MRCEQTSKNGRCVARALAPEDIRAGQYVCILYVVEEFLPWFHLFGEPGLRPVELLRVQHCPDATSAPMRVVEVCLPFVLVKDVDGDHRTIDIRRHRLARVTARMGRAAVAMVKAQRKRRKREDDDDGDD